MTSISRRSFLAVAAASGAAALSNTVSAQEKPSVSEKFKEPLHKRWVICYN